MFTASLVGEIPTTPFFVILAFPLSMAGICIFASIQAFRRAKLIEAMPTSQIGSAPDGYVELEGRAEAVRGQTLRAPLTG